MLARDLNLAVPVISGRQLVALLALRQASGARASRLARLLCGHPDPEAVAAGAEARPQPAHWRAAHRQAVAVRALGLTVVPAWALPKAYSGLAWMPLALFVRGDPTVLALGAVSIIGTRRASRGARGWASR